MPLSNKNVYLFHCFFHECDLGRVKHIQPEALFALGQNLAGPNEICTVGCWPRVSHRPEYTVAACLHQANDDVPDTRHVIHDDDRGNLGVPSLRTRYRNG
jgi:hypothetical protein